jgi:hypothetical protein
MHTSLAAIRERGGRGAQVILQVERGNSAACHLYQALGFADEGTFTQWRRPSGARTPPPFDPQPAYMTRRRRGEWPDELALARRARPGGIGWLRPLDPALFRPSLWKTVNEALSLRSFERLVVRRTDQTHHTEAYALASQRLYTRDLAAHLPPLDPALPPAGDLLAALWVEQGLGADNVQLTLMVDPQARGVYDEVLVNTAARRFTGSGLVTEHPADDPVMAALLPRYHFIAQRTLVHMRWRA